MRRFEDRFLLSLLFDSRQFHLFEQHHRSDDGRGRRDAAGTIVDRGDFPHCDDFSQGPHIDRVKFAPPDGFLSSSWRIGVGS